MPVYPFPYTLFPTGPTPGFPKGRIAPRPLLKLTIKNREQSLNCYGLVDSGADYCCFPLSFAAAMGLDPLAATLDGAAGLGSYNVPTYFREIGIDLQGIAQFRAYVGFTTGLENWGFGLLGQTGFFDRFKVTFDPPNGLYHLEIP